MATPTIRNPTWSTDELILALELYVRFGGNPPGKSSKPVTDLSSLLNKMGQQLMSTAADFRNPNGVYMKVMNFRRFDPTYTSQGKVGLQRGGKEEKIVWDEFINDPKTLELAANAIRQNVEAGTVADLSTDEDEEIAEADEGRILTRVHRHRERSRKLIASKKASVLKKHGNLVCEACSFDFQRTYGLRGAGFVEAHHTKPVHTLLPGSTTRLEDLALLCSNCHRMIHVKKPWLSVGELKALLFRKTVQVDGT